MPASVQLLIPWVLDFFSLLKVLFSEIISVQHNEMPALDDSDGQIFSLLSVKIFNVDSLESCYLMAL